MGADTWMRATIEAIDPSEETEEALPNLAQRVFVRKGKRIGLHEWPRLVITIDSSVRAEPSFDIECQMKKGPKEHWRDASIPNELIDDLIEMLLEAKVKLL